MTPFGWRCVCALFGILMVPVCYAFMRKISRNTWIASFAAALMVFDFMHFTLSRIGTRDVIVAFFYPVLSGYPVKKVFAEQWLEWLESWVLS